MLKGVAFAALQLVNMICAVSAVYSPDSGIVNVNGTLSLPKLSPRTVIEILRYPTFV